MGRGLGIAAVAAVLALAGCASSSKTATPTRASSPRGATASGGPREEGLASYYAASLAGRPTASGEPYDPAGATCAHKKLRFGTRVRITVIETGRSVTCRVNDRGPYVAGRIVDVSGALASELGLLRRGVARVVVEIIEGAPERRSKKRR